MNLEEQAAIEQQVVNEISVQKKVWTKNELLNTKEGRLRLQKAMIRSRLSAFTIQTFKTVSPGDQYLHNWHIDAISDHLEACYRREIKRLIINIPPRTMKSISASVAFPAWALGRDPSLKFICASYAASLSIKHSIDCRLVMESPWYKEAFPNTVLAEDQNAKNKFMTTSRGQRFATSVGGAVLGEGGDFLIMDDPVKADEADSEVTRDTANHWFKQSFMTRLNDRVNGVVIVIMQRLHYQDLTAVLMEQGGWENLCLPLYLEEQPRKIYFGSITKKKEKREKVWNVGEVLQPKRFPPEVIEQLKKDLGSYTFAGQYLQRPAPLGGGMVKLSWFPRYDTIYTPENAKQSFSEIVQSWDTAFKENELNDPSACTTWGIRGNDWFLLDSFAQRMEYPDLKRTVINMAAKWQPNTVLIEDKASGQSLIQDLRRETPLGVVACQPMKDKVVRLSSVSALMEAGRVHLPKVAGWLVDYEAELAGFPNAAHDDRVDSTSQFLRWKRDNAIVARIRRF